MKCEMYTGGRQEEKHWYRVIIIITVIALVSTIYNKTLRKIMAYELPFVKSLK